MKNKIKKMIMKSLKHDKMRKEGKLKGFTLVELIVVIAIIGVLAAILIPTLMGRVKQSRLATANDAAAKIAESINIVVSDMENQGVVVGNGTYYAYEVDTSKDAQTNLTDAIKQDIPTANDGHWAVEIEKNAIVAVVYIGNGSNYVGTYPTPAVDAVDDAGDDPTVYLNGAKAGATAAVGSEDYAAGASKKTQTPAGGDS